MKRIKPIHPNHWDRKRLKELVEKLSRRRVLVIGDVGIDRYTIGAVERISPEAPVPIVRVEEEKFKLGLAANVADNVKALGGVPLLTGVVGRDRAADDFKKLLRGAKIDPKYLVPDSQRRTVLKERIVSDRQQLLRVDYESEGVLTERTEQQLIKRIKELAPECDAIILEDYAKGMITKRLARVVFSTASRLKKKVAVDPNMKTSIDIYQGATILTPNTREAEALAGQKITDKASLIEVGTRILSRAKARHVVITRGKEGMAVFSAGSSTVHLIPTHAREVYDVSGAGDTVIAVLTLALAAGAKIEEAAVLGNVAAGVEVGKRGTATVSQQEILVELAAKAD